MEKKWSGSAPRNGPLKDLIDKLALALSPGEINLNAEDEDGSIDSKPLQQHSKQVDPSKFVNMGRELQKKKNRSSINKIKNKVKTKSAKKRVNPLGNAIIAANWDKEQTLTQNYKRLGLSSRLNSATGGTEKLASNSNSTSERSDRLAINNAIPTTFAPTEARIERDPETGAILRVIHSKKETSNPLNDPMNTDDEEEEFSGFAADEPQSHGIVRELEEQAKMEAEKKPRKQSQREQEWIQRLVRAHGDDFVKMSRDRKLNPMQQTAADIGRRVAKWKAAGGQVPIVA